MNQGDTAEPIVSCLVAPPPPPPLSSSYTGAAAHLPCRVPDLQLDPLPCVVAFMNLDDPAPELDANSCGPRGGAVSETGRRRRSQRAKRTRFRVLEEAVVGEADEEGRLAASGVSQEDLFLNLQGVPPVSSSGFTRKY